MYEILFHPAFKKDLKKIPAKAIKRIEKLVDEVALNPLKCKQLHGDMKKIRKKENFYQYLKRRMG
jgi:mRNA-degrading endonuclease RelE of RelBE toxin-antitoxin system